MPEYKSWLQDVKDDSTKARCRACNAIFSCGKSELEKHRNSAKHIGNEKLLKNPSVSAFFKPAETFHNKNVKRAEIKLAAFFAEHNVAFNTIDHLTPLLCSIFPDSKICQDLTLGRTKATKIVSNLLNPVQNEDLCQILKTNVFSVLLDESTDIESSKNLCCLVRFLDMSDRKLKTELLELIKVDASDCSSDSLYKHFKRVLLEKDIPLKNICGFSCDNAAVMIGKNNSFYTRLKEDVPDVVIIKCTCHSSALIASKASKHIPKQCEDLLKAVVNYISDSSKSCAILREFQEYFNLEKRKLLSPAKTRWLAMQPCIVRFLENWTALEHMFLYDTVEKKKKKAQEILELMKNKCIKAYFYLLKFVLAYFNTFNALFQSRQILIHKMYPECCILLRKIGQNFIKSCYIDFLENITDITDEHILQDTDIYLGPECENYVKENLDANQKIEIKIAAKNVYLTAFKELKIRLPFDDPLFKEMEFLNPEVALDASKRIHSKELNILPNKVNCCVPTLKTEWRDLPVSFSKEEKERLTSLSVEEFWSEVNRMKNFKDELMFENLAKLANFAIVLPHSNAEAERIFSIVTEVKNTKRNRMGEKCLNAVCCIRSNFQANGLNCVTFEPTQKHFSLHNSKLYE